MLFISDAKLCFYANLQNISLEIFEAGIIKVKGVQSNLFTEISFIIDFCCILQE